MGECSTGERHEPNRVLQCCLCDKEQSFPFTQTAVGQGWRIASFFVRDRLESGLWYCPEHVTTGHKLDQTIKISVEGLKKDILESVKQRVLKATEESNGR